jgi:hypothetical protein
MSGVLRGVSCIDMALSRYHLLPPPSIYFFETVEQCAVLLSFVCVIGYRLETIVYYSDCE